MIRVIYKLSQYKIGFNARIDTLHCISLNRTPLCHTCGDRSTQIKIWSTDCQACDDLEVKKMDNKARKSNRNCYSAHFDGGHHQQDYFRNLYFSSYRECKCRGESRNEVYLKRKVSIEEFWRLGKERDYTTQVSCKKEVRSNVRKSRTTRLQERLESKNREPQL